MNSLKRWTQEIPVVKHRPPVQTHVFVDTESKWSQADGQTPITRHTLRFGVAFFCRWNGTELIKESEIIFTTKEQFWDWMEKCKANTRTWVWAHNLAFDGTLIGLWDILQSEGCKLIHFTDCDIPAFFQCNLHGRSYQFLDTLNIFRTSLANIGDELGLEKMEMPRLEDSIEQWIPYCRRDVEILHLIISKWIQFLQVHELGGMSPSLASQSLTAYRTKFMKHPIYIHNNSTAIKLERDSYCGGLVEPRFIGQVPAKRIYEYDVNSLYPYVMSKNRFPNLLVGTSSWPEMKQFKKLLRDYFCIAHVQLNTTTAVMPIKRSGRLMFPLGRYWATLSQPELERCMKLKIIESVSAVAWYTDADLFSKYVSYFYGVRRSHIDKGEKTFEYMCKIFMNSLYGKFGQRRPLWEPYSEDMVGKLEYLGGLKGGELDIIREHILCHDQHELKFRHPYNDQPYGARWLLGQAQLLMGEGESPWSFPAIASAVTSYAREYVRNIQAMIPKQCLFYTDTDSFFVNAAGKHALGLHNMIDEITLGKLKAKTVNDHMTIYGPKDYETNNEVKRKGVRSKAKEIAKNTFTQDQFPGFKGLARGKFPTHIDVKTITKVLKRHILTMQVDDKGWTHPYYLDIDNYVRY